MVQPPKRPPASRPVGHWASRINRVRKDIGLAHGFRSGLEEKNAEHLEALGEVVLFEATKITYLVPESRHRYTPDFPLRNGIIAETKGLFESKDRAKHLFVKAQYPELDIRLVFSNPKAKISKGSPTTYAMWCEKNGIKWAGKLIPKEWLNEAGPKYRPEEVIQRGPYGYMTRDKEAA